MKVDPLTGEAQRCFTTEDGFRICNFTMHNGKARRSKLGKWLKFKVLRRLKKKDLPAQEDPSSKQLA